MSTMFWLWLAAGVIFLIVEIGAPGLLYACFAVGAFGAAITAAFSDSYLLQLAVFAGIPLILIPLTRPLAKRITTPPPRKTNVDALVGRPGMVLKKIDPENDTGQIRVEGQVWQAVSDGPIETGTRIRVERAQGARLYVVAEPNGKEGDENPGKEI
jgi:membrane protein implicated in regulation of membrane protease activity